MIHVIQGRQSPRLCDLLYDLHGPYGYVAGWKRHDLLYDLPGLDVNYTAHIPHNVSYRHII